MPNIGNVLGGIGRGVGEFALNLANPQRQQFQHEAQMMKMKALMEAQQQQGQRSFLMDTLQKELDARAAESEAQRQNALALAGLQQLGNQGIPGDVKASLAMRGGVPEHAIPRVPRQEGYTGPDYLKAFDPAAWQPQMNPLQQAQIGSLQASTAKDLRPPGMPDSVTLLHEKIRQAQALGLPMEYALGGSPQKPEDPIPWLNLINKMETERRGETITSTNPIAPTMPDITKTTHPAADPGLDALINAVMQMYGQKFGEFPLPQGQPAAAAPAIDPKKNAAMRKAAGFD